MLPVLVEKTIDLVAVGAVLLGWVAGAALVALRLRDAAPVVPGRDVHQRRRT